MTYKEAIEKINSLLVFGSKPGLERVRELVERAGSPQKKLRFIHVAGTNGKGSVCAMLSSVLRCAGYKTGLFISPYVLEFRERFQINGEMIPEETLAEIVDKLFPIVEQMKNEGKIITEFELVLAVGLEWYAQENCDVVVLETGLGGRFDATNIIDTPLASVIMSISLDHTAILGDTYEKIAFEKCGIIKPGGITILYGDQPEGVREVVEKAANEKNNRLMIADKNSVRKIDVSLDGTRFVFSSDCFNKGTELEFKIPFIGEHQIKNAAAALYTISALRDNGMNIPTSKVAEGLKNAVFPARMEVFGKAPVIILDGAHNPGGTHALSAAISELLHDKHIIGIAGMLADKDVKGALAELVPLFDRIITVTPDNPRAMQASELSKIVSSFGVSSQAEDDYKTAFEKAMSYTDSNGAIVVFGSLYLASDMRRVITSYFENN